MKKTFGEKIRTYIQENAMMFAAMTATADGSQYAFYKYVFPSVQK